MLGVKEGRFSDWEVDADTGGDQALSLEGTPDAVLCPIISTPKENEKRNKVNQP